METMHVKKIKPLFTKLLITGERYKEDLKTNGLIMDGHKKGDLKLYQRVISIGRAVQDIQPGDWVMFNPYNYRVMKYDPNSVKDDMGMNKVEKYILPWVEVEDEKGKPVDLLYVDQRDIEYVFEGEEESNTIIVQKPNIIV